MGLQEKIDRLLTLLEQGQTFPEYLEIPHDVWERLKGIARSKNFILSDIDFKTNDGKTLVTLDTEDSWQQLLTYLDLEDIKDYPTRELTLANLGQAKAFPQAEMKQVTITANLAAGELPADEEIREILTANLKPINARIQDLQVIKQGGNVIIKTNVVSDKGKEIQDSEIERLLKTNLDKIIKISDIEVKAR